jgi:hypothetical protein
MVHGISTDSTSPSSGEVRTTTLTVTATSTTAQSYDGFVISQAFGNATGTAGLFSIRNSYGVNLTCSKGTPVLDFTSSGYTAAQYISVSTSSTAVGSLTTGLLASTTVATTSAPWISSVLNESWKWGTGTYVNGSLFDGTGFEGSSTGLANLAGKVRFHCWLNN